MKYNGAKSQSLLSRYVSRVKAWSEAGYVLFYSQIAVAVGNTGFGFLVPFHLILEKLNDQNKQASQKQKSVKQYDIQAPFLKKKNTKHRQLKATVTAYRGLYRYVKTLSRLNEDFIMRPVANIFALMGGVIGLAVGLPLSLFGFHPPKQDNVTKDNQFFETINIHRETRNFFGVLVWGAIAGYIFGTFYTAPITILGNTFQGASAFSGLFSGVATFVYQLPTLIKNTWTIAKKLVTTLRDAVIWVHGKLKPIGEFIADKLGWLLKQGQRLLNFIGQKIKAGLTKGYEIALQACHWVKDQFNFVLGKISNFLTVIKENGIRGLIAFIKEKTIGAALRYVDDLAAVRTARNDIRTTLNVLLTDVQKTKAVFQLISKEQKDILPNKTDNLNLVMVYIEQIAEAHRTNYQHGSIQVKLNYLEILKLSLDDLKGADFESVEELSPDLVRLLDSNYRSWQSAEKEPEPVDFLGDPIKTHLPQHKSQQSRASNDDTSTVGDELKSKKSSWFSCCR